MTLPLTAPDAAIAYGNSATGILRNRHEMQLAGRDTMARTAESKLAEGGREPAIARGDGRAAIAAEKNSTDLASVNLTQVKADPEVRALIDGANENLGALGYTEHGFRHADLVARDARFILRTIGYSKREQELAAIAGYLHDIGNVVSRHGHARSSSLLAHEILSRLGADPRDTVVVMGAIGSHEDEGHVGDAVHAVSAALILADKADVHRSRVRNREPTTFDQHDRVNYAATSSRLIVDPEEKSITLVLEIDTRIAPVMHYFEIFLPRMLMSRRAAETLGYTFRITINGVSVL